MLVSYVDNQTLGYLMDYERYPSFYIRTTGVLPQHHRHRIFVQLMQRMEPWTMNTN